MNNSKNKIYHCCFCDALIESSQSNPCVIDILINITHPKDKQYIRSFYCHMECFKQQLHEQIKSYFYLECLVESNAMD